MSDPKPAGPAADIAAVVPEAGDPRLGPEDRASILALIEGDDLLDLLDSTGDTIHGYDPAP
ncbi:MAG: hypothetical protein OXG69_16255 [bacterium]|nr:hypothetical protein [bacterium]